MSSIIATIVQWMVLPSIIVAVFELAWVIAKDGEVSRAEGLGVGRFPGRIAHVPDLRREPARADRRSRFSRRDATRFTRPAAAQRARRGVHVPLANPVRVAHAARGDLDSH